MYFLLEGHVSPLILMTTLCHNSGGKTELKLRQRKHTCTMSVETEHICLENTDMTTGCVRVFIGVDIVLKLIQILLFIEGDISFHSN